LESETVLVTGGAGFIGSVLCRALLARGARVVAYDNVSRGRRELLPVHPQCLLVEGDIRDGARLRALLREHAPRVVCHLAALHFIPYCNAHPWEAVEVNVNGTRALLAACRETRPQRLLFASTAAVYPAEGSPFAEEHPAGPLDVYGSTKLMGEELSRLFFLETGVPTVIARFFNAFGPSDTNPHLIPDMLEQLQGGGDTLRLGNLEPVRDYVHVEDLVDAVAALATHHGDGCQVVNVGSGEGRSVRDVVSAFEAACARPLRVVQDSAKVRKVERSALVADVGKLRRETGWEPRISFAEGIRRLVAGRGTA